MFKKAICILTAISLIAVVSPVGAQPARVLATLDSSGTNRTLMLPANADNSPVISLGTAVDPATGEVVEGYAIVHFRKGFAKGGGSGGGGTTCYAYLSSGAKWKSVEPWVMNTSNGFGLTDEFLMQTQSAGITKWEDATNGIIGDSLGVQVLGDGTSVADILVADSVSPDNVNEVYFGSISEQNAIAVTTVWGVFGGAPAGRKLVEWDMVFNTTYDWSASGEANKMDFDNISTHETGHAVGMGDLYNSCVNETMYGYADYGQTNKRDLNGGDILGANKLY